MTQIHHGFPTLQAICPEMWEKTVRRVVQPTGQSPTSAAGVGIATVPRTELKEST